MCSVCSASAPETFDDDGDFWCGVFGASVWGVRFGCLGAIVCYVSVITCISKVEVLTRMVPVNVQFFGGNGCGVRRSENWGAGWKCALIVIGSIVLAVS